MPSPASFSTRRSAQFGSTSATKTYERECRDSSACRATRLTPSSSRSNSLSSSARWCATEERSLSIPASRDELEDLEGAVALRRLDDHRRADLGVHQRPAD